ncbi:MAG TPA: SUF system NifU family Fe-S cluster assembly protein [Thermoanaerobaculia bacterium]|jgi:nitrogen fixation NifU-like protein|nr:SUF system NifU family Fe-S cluster assembly protein [Thermoanaerobaculia bacterium]
MSASGDLRDLYQDLILDHTRKPRNFHPLPQANRRAEGHNPLCGDRISLAFDVADGTIREAAFEGSGCAISVASASMLTEAVTGKTVEEARRLLGAFLTQTAGAAGTPGAADVELGKLEAFAGVREFPMRVKCATLAWRALEAALAGGQPEVRTE